MNQISIPKWSRTAFALLIATALPLGIKASSATPSPKVSFSLKDRHGHATPERIGFTHTGGGNTLVEQPTGDTVVVTMTGVAVAGPHPFKNSQATLRFDLTQELKITFSDPKLKRARLTIDAQIIGLLRGDSHSGSAGVCHGAAAVSAAGATLLAVAIEGHTVMGGENLSINDHKGPVSVSLMAGDYVVSQGFDINASHGRGWGKAASAEFAPDPALDPLWISYWEPFHGVAKKDFGFRVTYHVEPG